MLEQDGNSPPLRRDLGQPWMSRADKFNKYIRSWNMWWTQSATSLPRSGETTFVGDMERPACDRMIAGQEDMRRTEDTCLENGFDHSARVIGQLLYCTSGEQCDSWNVQSSAFDGKSARLSPAVEGLFCWIDVWVLYFPQQVTWLCLTCFFVSGDWHTKLVDANEALSLAEASPAVPHSARPLASNLQCNVCRCNRRKLN